MPKYGTSRGKQTYRCGARLTLELVRERQAAARPAGGVAVVISLDEAWTYQGCRKGAGRLELWIWTAVVADGAGAGGGTLR